jgi:hypothetical protein
MNMRDGFQLKKRKPHSEAMVPIISTMYTGSMGPMTIMAMRPAIRMAMLTAVVMPSMLSSMLMEFIMPTTQKKVMATLAHVRSNTSMHRAGSHEDATAGHLDHELQQRVGVVGIIRQAHEEPEGSGSQQTQEVRPQGRFGAMPREEHAVQGEAGQEEDVEADATERRFGTCCSSAPAPGPSHACPRCGEAHEDRVDQQAEYQRREEEARSRSGRVVWGCTWLSGEFLDGHGPCDRNGEPSSVLRAHDGSGDAPVDRQVGIVPADGAFGCRG